MHNINSVICCLLVTTCFSMPSFFDESNNNNRKEESLKIRDQESFIRSFYERNWEELEKKYLVIPSIHLKETTYQEPNNLTLVGFSWKNCGQPRDPVQVSTMNVSPDPITIPGTETVTLDAVIKTTVETATSLSLTVKKKIFGVYVKIPCVNNVGSCTYEKPCDMLKNITCPEEFKEHGFTCQCPFAAKEYKLDNVSVKIPAIKLPSYVENGDYEIEASLKNGDNEILCYSVTASLEAA